MRIILVSLVPLLLCSLTFSQGPVYDPEGVVDPGTYTCAEHIEIVELEDGRGDVRTVWAHGYYSGLRGIGSDSPPLTGAAVIAFASRLDEACRSRLSGLFFETIADLATAEADRDPDEK